MEITYTMQGDYLLPNLTLPEQDNRPIGLWGQQHLRYIKRSRPILYTNLLTKCRLNEYLADIDEQAQKMYDELVQSFAKEEGCTEQLKATDQMLWVRKMNNANQRAREVVNVYRNKPTTEYLPTDCFNLCCSAEIICCSFRNDTVITYI